MEDHRKLKEFLKIKNLSLANFLKEIISGPIGSYEEGYQKGKQDWQIWYFCSKCRGKVVIFPNGKSHVYLSKHLHEKGWRHSKCPNVPKRDRPVIKKSSGTMVKLKKTNP